MSVRSPYRTRTCTAFLDKGLFVGKSTFTDSTGVTRPCYSGHAKTGRGHHGEKIDPSKIRHTEKEQTTHHTGHSQPNSHSWEVHSGGFRVVPRAPWNPNGPNFKATVVYFK